MNVARAKPGRTNAQRNALLAAGIAPSRDSQRKPPQPHRDSKHAAARGERKQPWN